MRVLHAPVNIAGQPYTLVRALRRRGLDAQLVVFKERPFVRGYDRSLHLERRRSRLAKWLVALQAFVQAAPRYDIFHLHGSLSLLYPFRWDLPIQLARGADSLDPVILHPQFYQRFTRITSPWPESAKGLKHDDFCGIIFFRQVS